MIGFKYVIVLYLVKCRIIYRIGVPREGIPACKLTYIITSILHRKLGLDQVYFIYKFPDIYIIISRKCIILIYYLYYNIIIYKSSHI